MSEQSTAVDRPPVPISVGLLSRRSLLGAIVVLGVSLFFIVVLPIINSAVKGENPFIPGQPYVVSGTVQITPQPGWELGVSSDLLTTITKSGASFVVVGAAPADQTPEESIQGAIEGLQADQNNTWVIGDPQTFVTDAGDHGVKLTAHTTNDAQESWAISSGEVSTTVLATSPDSVWGSVVDELEAMASSVVFVTEGGGE